VNSNRAKLTNPLPLHQIGGELPKAFAEGVAFDALGFLPDVHDLKERFAVRRTLVHTDASITDIAFDGCTQIFGHAQHRS